MWKRLVPLLAIPLALLIIVPSVRALSDQQHIEGLVNFVNDGMNQSVRPCDDFYGYVCSNHSQSSLVLLMKSFYQYIKPIIKHDTKYPDVSINLLNYVEQCQLFRENLTYQRVSWHSHLKKYGVSPLIQGSDEQKLPNYWKGLFRIILFTFYYDHPADGLPFMTSSPLGINFNFNAQKNELELFASHDKAKENEENFTLIFEKSWNTYLTIFSIENSTDIETEKQKVSEFSQQFKKLIDDSREINWTEVPTITFGKLKDRSLQEAIYELLPYHIDDSVNMGDLKVKVDEKLVDTANSLFNEYPREGQHFIHLMAIRNSLPMNFKSFQDPITPESDSSYQCFFNAIHPSTLSLFNLYTADLVIRHEVQMTTVGDQVLIRDMIELIRQEIRKKFIATYWMKDSRELLQNLDHLLGLFKVIGFSEEFYEDNNMTTSEFIRFSNYEGDFLSTIERLRMLNLRLSKTLPVEAYKDWFEINAYNMGDHINLHFLILQNPFFNRRFPDSYNIGLTGSTIGHEFLHSFAPNLVQSNYYQHIEYNQSLACYMKFYNKKMCYNLMINGKIERICADGANDLSENIPDVEGARVAFDALKHKLASAEMLKQKPLPNYFDFTNEQLFFVAMAQFFCDKRQNDPERFAQDLKREGPHGANVVRVNAVAMQMSEFAEAFHCKSTDAMVTEEVKKCYLLPSSE